MPGSEFRDRIFPLPRVRSALLPVRAVRPAASAETLMAGLPCDAPAIAVVRHHWPTLDDEALVAKLVDLLPFARGYAESLSLPLARLTVAHIVRFVWADKFQLASELAAYFEGTKPDGSPRFSPETRRVYVQHVKRLALLLYQARQDVFGDGAHAWSAWTHALAAVGRSVNPKYRHALVLWSTWCRQREVDPLRPANLAADLKNYLHYLEAWGYSAKTFKRYGWIVRSMLALLGVAPPPHLPLGPYAQQVPDLMVRLRGWCHEAYEAATFDGWECHAAMYARFLLSRALKPREGESHA